MLDKVFISVLNMSFSGAVVILIIFFARLFLRKVPKVFSYSLWSVALLRLICPFSFESVLSLFPTKPTPISESVVYSKIPQIDTGINVINNSINPILPTSEVIGTSVNPLQIWLFFGETLWLLGILVIFIFSAISFIKLKKKLSNVLFLEENIYMSDNIKTPFVMGVINPCIYLPSDLSEAEKGYIILHEKTHIRRFDHIIKFIAFLTFCIHWFNPFCWAGFFAFSKDMEMSCDERVIKKLGSDVKKDYSQSLLSLSTGRKIINGGLIAFGEGDTKGRIKNVLSYKKPKLWVSVICLIAVILLCVGLFFNPSNEKTENKIISQDEVQKADYNENLSLYNYRTKNFKDEDNCLNIAKILDYPNKFCIKDFTVKASEINTNYIRLYFNVDSETLQDCKNGTYEKPFLKNASIIFSLVKDLDLFEINVDDAYEEFTFKFGRDEAESLVGVDLWEESKTKKSFNKLLDKIDKHIDNAIVSATEIPDNKIVLSQEKSNKDMIFPVEEPYKILEDFGAYEWCHEGHTGIDIEKNIGDPVYATLGGTVKEIKDEEWGYGKAVIIEHEKDFLTVYGYLSEIDVEYGEEVKQGKIIGKVGKSGRATNSCLHFEVRQDRFFANPWDFINNEDLFSKIQNENNS